MHGKLTERGNTPNLWQEASNACRLKFNYTLVRPVAPRDRNCLTALCSCSESTDANLELTFCTDKGGYGLQHRVLFMPS